MATNSTKRPSAITRIQGRVDTVLPNWLQWPRKLRRIYVLLETFGCSDESISEMCNEFKWDLGDTRLLMIRTLSFMRGLEEYREKGQYPRANNWKNRLRASELQALYAYESAIVQFMHLEDRRGQGTFGIKLVDQTGLLGEAAEDDVGVVAGLPHISLPDWSEFEEATSESTSI